ncbi:cutinase family protein [Nocardia ignorata]|uniref:cutinase family protein n=1 Tax=Nocardia ignorata TaxID=145285 RepID=UPI003627DD36
MIALTRSTRSVARTVAALAVAGTVGSGVATFTDSPAAAVPIGPGCPALYVLGVQGTGQSSPTADALADTGVVGALIAPVLRAAPGLVQRSYIAYGAGFGGAVPGGGPDPYSVSVTDARNQLDAAAAEIADACPETMIAGVGYSQGAQAMANFAADIGAGSGPIGADRIAGIALYANPDRAPGSPVIAGRPGQIVPDPAPGTSGAAVSQVAITNPSAGGGGIAGSISYGALAGRVADICTDGDLACSAPDRAAFLRVGAEIAAQTDLRNPIAALGTVNELLHSALGDAWSTAILEDFLVGADTVDYRPQQGLAARLVQAADPRTTAPDSAAAAARWAEIVATATANPVAVLPQLAGQLAAAWGQVLADNADLINPAVLARYGDTVGRHNNYATSGQLATGVAWMVALAHDIAGR